MAKEQGFYVLLDLHGAPGAQSPWEHTGELSRNKLFSTDAFQKRTFAHWGALVKRYREEPAVFAYGCLNEPAGASGPKNWMRVHYGIYDAIETTH